MGDESVDWYETYMMEPPNVGLPGPGHLLHLSGPTQMTSLLPRRRRRFRDYRPQPWQVTGCDIDNDFIDDLTPVISRMFLHIRRWRSRHQVAARQLRLMVFHLTRTM